MAKTTCTKTFKGWLPGDETAKETMRIVVGNNVVSKSKVALCDLTARKATVTVTVDVDDA